ncbi:MAG: hypothetical protein N3E49_06230 [Bacteroidia bacterium]|nr:hypothetical protein [Bacteroidia bacterium]
MATLSVYLGLFTGLLISGIGAYLYVHPLDSGLPAWAQQGLPLFMIAYGAVRFGFSLYKLLRRKGREGIMLGLTLIFPLLMRCSSASEANLRLRFDYLGECSTCPISRMDSILRLFFPVGVFSVALDSAQHQVVVDLDSNHVRLDTLRQVLLAYGYEINEEISVDPILSSCCAIPEFHSAGSEAGPLAGPSASEIQEDMTLLERELEQELGVSPDVPNLNLDSELNLDEDLGLEELDLEGGGFEPIDDLGLEELDVELELEMEESQPRKKKPAPPKP